MSAYPCRVMPMTQGPATDKKRRALRRRLTEIQGELARAQGELAAMGAGESLPGLHLVVEAAGQRGLVSDALVVEVVRLVACSSLPGMPRHVLGSFLHRGRPAVAVDLASILGSAREPSLDAHVVVMAGARPLGLVVDAVSAVVDSPLLVADGPDGPSLAQWRSADLVTGLCRVGDEIVPLLGFGPLLDLIKEAR